MENVTSQQILSIITIVLLLVLIAPKVVRLNMARGTALRNTVLWLLLFVGLIWVYQFMHPTTTVEPNGEPTPMGIDTE